MTKKLIRTNGELSAQNIFFMEKSQDRLFADHGNPYSCQFRGKFIIANDSAKAPDACYVLIKAVEERNTAFVAMDYEILNPQPVLFDSFSLFEKDGFCTRPDFCLWDTYKCYSAKTKVGNIPVLVCKYKMHTGNKTEEMDATYYDAYLYLNGCFLSATLPHAFWGDVHHSDPGITDFANCDFYDFVEL